jgi:hypothetical protein
MQRFEIAPIRLERAFCLGGIRLCGGVGEVDTALRVVMVLRATADNIRVWDELRC